MYSSMLIYNGAFTIKISLIILRCESMRSVQGGTFMKTYTLTLLLLLFGMISLAEAQLREDLSRSGSLTGAIYQSNSSATTSALSSFFNNMNMEMGHSYSMTMGSVGGEFRNVNAYTNHMAFDFSENLTGNLDISLLHSPFGGSAMGMGMGGQGLGQQVVIDRAQIDYKISPNTHLSIQFSQRPYSSYFGGYATPFGRRGNFWY